MQEGKEGLFKRRIQKFDEEHELEWTDWEGVGWDIGKKYFLEWIEDAKKEFPIEFWMDLIEEVEDGNSKITKVPMLDASLMKNRANASINTNKVFDWFKKWFGE